VDDGVDAPHRSVEGRLVEERGGREFDGFVVVARGHGHAVHEPQRAIRSGERAA